MYSAQAIAPKYANVYASFDTIWSDAGDIVTGNNAETDPSGLIYMGAGPLMPFKITEERGLWMMGGQNCTTAHDFSADEPFSIAILTDSAMTAAGWLAATFDSSTNLGVRFGASAAGTLVATLQNASGSIVQTATNSVQPSIEKRLFVLTYDGSGLASGLKIHVDGVTCASVSSGTSVSGSLSSGRDLSFGSQWNAGVPDTFMVGRLYAVAVFPFVLDSAMRSMLREKMRHDVHAEYPARYAETPAWTPALLPQPGDSWLWADLDATGAVTRNTQPDTSGGWAGANWTGSGLGPYTHTPGDATALAAAIAIVGNRYLTRFTVSDRTAGSVTFYAGTTAGTARSTNATFTEELTCAGSTSHNFVPSADFDGKVTVDSVVVVANLSVSGVTCKGTLGNLVQATAENMPWSSDADAPTSLRVNGRDVLYFDGVADYAAGSGAASEYAFHKADGFTFLTWLSPDITAAGNDTIIDTCNASALGVGINITYDATAQKLWVRVANGSGTWVINEGLPLAKGLPHLVDATWTEAAGLSLTVSSLITTRTITQASVGSASAADASAVLQYGRGSGGADYYAGSAAGMMMRVGAVDAASLATWRTWAKAYWGVSETATAVFASTNPWPSWIVAATAGATYTIDWGDGTVDAYTGSGANQTPVHAYAAAGVYRIRWTFANPAAVTYFNGVGNSVLTGDIGDLAGMTGLQNLQLYSTAVTGDIGDLAGMTGMQNLRLNSTAVTYTTTALPAWATCDIRAYSCGWNTATVDQFMIDLADGVGANGKLYIAGTNAARSAASDAAKATLLAAGWTPVEVNE